MGVAPEVNILSVRVLDENGQGTYADVIQGIQFVVRHKDIFKIRVMNLSLSAWATTPYFADPLNRAAEAAWANGIVVVAAAGNDGPGSETITVPGNDPYVITVGALNSERTPGFWEQDEIPSWSANGPTLDGFIKPDVLAPGASIVSFIHKDFTNDNNSAWLARNHPGYAQNTTFFRMSGTSMATAVTSGVVALMLQVNPNLTPDQVKFRLKYSSKLAMSPVGEPVYNLFQQGHGRIWAPDAVFGTFPEDGLENLGMDIQADLAHGTGWMDANGDGLVQMTELNPTEMSYHFQGPVGRLTSDDGQAYLYYLTNPNGQTLVVGAASVMDRTWLDRNMLDSMGLDLEWRPVRLAG